MIRRLAAMLSVCVFVVACSSPTGPTDGGTDRVTATIDGQPYSASVMAANILTVNGASNLNVTTLNGCQGDTTLQITLQPASGTGTFSTGQPGVSVGANVNRMSGGQSVGVWGSSNGTVTITSLSSTRVAGTFNFPTLTQFGGGAGATTRSVTNGSFDIQLADRKLC